MLSLSFDADACLEAHDSTNAKRLSSSVSSQTAGTPGMATALRSLGRTGSFVLCFVRLASAKCTLDMFVSDYRML